MLEEEAQMMNLDQVKNRENMKVTSKYGKSYYYDYKAIVVHPRIHNVIKKRAEELNTTMSQLLFDTFNNESGGNR